MIETEEGVRHGQEIVETPGVSAVETVHIPEADAARILRMCLERKVVAAQDVSPADVAAKITAGYRMISVGWDFALLQRSLAESVEAMRSAIR